MGIKFFCPNGHKIHVKSFLAGKRGICPDCGVSVTIPTPSTSEDEDNEGNALPPPPVAGGAKAKVASGAPPVVAAGPAVVRPAAVAVVPAPVAPAAMPQPVAVAAPVAPRAVVAAQPVAPMPMPMAVPAGPAVKVVPVAMAAPLAGMPVPPPPPAPPPAPLIAPGGDPIAQAPLAVWYVRPKGGEQFGPARGEIMRRWLGEGRVPADALVWREGWDDWKPAGETFPSLLGGAAVAYGAPAAPAGSAPGSKKSVDRVSVRRKSQNTMAWASIIILGLITTVMLGVLVYVLTR